MAKCVKCKEKKGKRYCPALGTYLCSLCCGQLREKEIRCPKNCSYLTKHKPYQESRIIEKTQASFKRPAPLEEDILKDEKMAWLAFHIEAPLKGYGERKDFFTDRDALLALEFAREKIEKNKSFMFIPEGMSRPKNEVGEAIYQSIENCRYEKKIILPGDVLGYKKEEKIKCLERVMFSVSAMSWGNLEGRNYIEQLIQRFSKLKELSCEKKIITS